MSDDNETEMVYSGVPMGFAALLMLALFIAIAGDFYFALRLKPECVVNDATLVQQAQSNMAFANLQRSRDQEANKRLTDLQLEVIKHCVAKSGVPVLINQNVDCKATGK